jgi:hypothetical protein
MVTNIAQRNDLNLHTKKTPLVRLLPRPEGKKLNPFLQNVPKEQTRLALKRKRSLILLRIISFENRSKQL